MSASSLAAGGGCRRRRPREAHVCRPARQYSCKATTAATAAAPTKRGRAHDWEVCGVQLAGRLDARLVGEGRQGGHDIQHVAQLLHHHLPAGRSAAQHGMAQHSMAQQSSSVGNVYVLRYSMRPGCFCSVF